MDPQRLRQLLARLQRGEVTLEQVEDGLRALPFRDLGVATVDHHRALRQGVPEVIFGLGKTSEQIITIAREMVAAGNNLLVTRLDQAKATALSEAVPGLDHHPIARLARLLQAPLKPRPTGPVAVISAGTSDMPVAEEATLTLETVGLQPLRVYDVGVAGIHRLFERLPELQKAAAAIVIAGMEGALPSVVGGILACPILAVPTSVGYGTAMAGFTALFSMLTSCASGISVVNIDNGFGAAMAVHRILPQAR